MVAHTKLNLVTAVPPIILTPVALLPLVHGTGVPDVPLVPYEPSVAEVLHSINESCDT